MRDTVIVLTVQQASVLKGAAQLGLATLRRQETRQGQQHEHGGAACPLEEAISAIRQQFEALVGRPEESQP